MSRKVYDVFVADGDAEAGGADGGTDDGGRDEVDERNRADEDDEEKEEGDGESAHDQNWHHRAQQALLSAQEGGESTQLADELRRQTLIENLINEILQLNSKLCVNLHLDRHHILLGVC